MQDKISVIVPIYNVEKYLEECLNSIVNQTYKNLEIILINDGSTDSSIDICKKFKQKDSRIVIINQKNKGVAVSRNIGIENATGKYISFVDSDDYIDSYMIERLYDICIKTSSDIAMCDFFLIDELGKITYKNSIKDVINVKELKDDQKFNLIYDKEMVTRMGSITIWNKLYNKNIFKNLKYPKGMIHEDEYMAHTILDRANKVAYINKEFYYYRKREGSITNSGYYIQRQDILDPLEKRYLFFVNTKRKKLAAKALKHYVLFIIKHYKYSMNETYSKQSKKILKKRFNKMLLPVILNIHLSLLIKAVVISFYIFPKITVNILLKKVKMNI